MYFVLWSQKNYIPLTVEEFNTEAEALDWINGRLAGSSDTSFEVIEGRKRKFKAVQVATKYVRE